MEDIRSRALHLCENIKMCFNVWKLVQYVQKHETGDLKRLLAIEKASGISLFYKDKRNTYKKDEQYGKEKLNELYTHWEKLTKFKTLKEYQESRSIQPKTNGESTTVDMDNKQPKLSDKERKILDKLLTFRTDAESYSAFCSFLEKLVKIGETSEKKIKLFRSMLIERLVKKDVRKLEIELGLDYDDKYTDYDKTFTAVKERKKILTNVKIELDGIFEKYKCPKKLDNYKDKFSHLAKKVMKKAKGKFLFDEELDNNRPSDVDMQRYQKMACNVLKCLVIYQHESTSPLALLCEYGTFDDMFLTLLRDNFNGIDVWSALLKDPDHNTWTDPINKFTDWHVTPKVASHPTPEPSRWFSPARNSRGPQEEKEYPSLVHYAAMNPSADILRYLFDEGLVSTTDDLKKLTPKSEKTPLHFAAQYSSIECIKFLCEKTKDGSCPFQKKNSLGETPLHLAANGGDLDTFNYVYDMFPEEELCLLDEAKFGQPLLYAAKSNRYECMGAILDKQAMADATVHDEECNTALHFISKEANSRWLAKLLKGNGLLGEKNEVGNSPIDWISHSRLKELLDNHTTTLKLERTKGDTSRKDYTEVIFTNLFGHHASGSDMKNIMAIAQSKNAEAPGDDQHRNLCLHPLCQALVSVKWQKIRKFFFLKLAFFLPFVFFLSLHPILQMQRDLRIGSDANDSSTLSDEQYNQWIELSLQGTHLFLLIQVVSGLLSLFVLTWPFVEKSATYVNTNNCNMRRVRRLLEFYWEELLWSDWYEYVLWVIAFMHLVDAISPIVVVIASWFSLFYVCSNHPSILPLRYMLVRILLRYIKFLIFSIGLIGGFALGFFLLVNKCKLDRDHEGVCAEGFDTLYMTMLKVPSMMMGEISFESFKFEASAHLQFLFGSFIFLITCCLFNMMNGLAINITTELEKNARVFSTIAQCEMIIEFEALLKQLSSWLEYFHLPGTVAINAVWIERIKVQPSTGECKNLEEYKLEMDEHKEACEKMENLWETNDKRKVEWLWIDRGYTMDNEIVRAALDCCSSNIYKDPSDVEIDLDFNDDDANNEDTNEGNSKDLLDRIIIDSKMEIPTIDSPTTEG
ncbi:uncharacterized protein LOC135946949 [Cloeon dipterum]|uniref:uncharacterized protein LOC135946949 n=1 Tax=Cloeon dipterum TaxID=197152 RepID=UPI0032204D9C